MRLSPRIVVPLLAALLVVAGLFTYFWFELHGAAYLANQSAHQPGSTLLASDFERAQNADEPITNGTDRALLHLRQGDLFALEGDYKSAEQEYRASVDAQGGLPALKKLAEAQLQRREMDALRSTLDQMKSNGAAVEDILLFNVLIDLRTGELEQAKTLLAQAGDSPQKHYGLAILSIIQGNNDAAKTELALVANGWEPTLRTYAGILQDAYSEFALFPESRDIHLETLLAHALAEVQECEIALPILADVTKKQDDYRDAWIVQGYCELTTERYDRALSSLERAYALDPEKPEIQYFLGRTYAALNDPHNATTFLQYALKNGFQPENEVRRMIAVEAQISGDLPMALDQLRSLATASGADLPSIANYVKVALQLQNFDEASKTAQNAVKKWPDDAQSYDILGWTLAAQKNKTDAETAFEKALQLDPTLDDAKQNLLNLGAAK